MQKWYDELARFEREGFEVIVDKTWEEIHVQDCFDDECYDIKQICEDIDSGKLDWFMLRVRVLVEGHELGSSYLGGCLYEDAREVLSDGTAEDQIYMAIEEAKKEVWPLMRKLQAINEEMERVPV
jgi:GH15 family glucan-1,4-alpha-glucosidase